MSSLTHCGGTGCEKDLYSADACACHCGTRCGPYNAALLLEALASHDSVAPAAVRTRTRDEAITRLAAAFVCIHYQGGPASIAWRPQQSPHTSAEQIRRAVMNDTASFGDIAALRPLAAEVLDMLGLVAADAAASSFVKCARAEATHVRVLKDVDHLFIGNTYPIIKRDLDDVVVDLGNGKRRIVYEDEHEWRKRVER